MTYSHSLAQTEDSKETDTNFGNHKSLANGVQKSDKVILREGLPHQTFERELLDQELKSKKTVKFNEFPYYGESLQLKEGDAKKLTALFCDPKSFEPFLGYKKCGGFHPDYCIEWQVGKEVYRAHICFGCHEMKCFGPKAELYCDISDDAYKQLEEILHSYRKNRPQPKDEK